MQTSSLANTNYTYTQSPEALIFKKRFIADLKIGFLFLGIILFWYSVIFRASLLPYSIMLLLLFIALCLTLILILYIVDIFLFAVYITHTAVIIKSFQTAYVKKIYAKEHISSIFIKEYMSYYYVKSSKIPVYNFDIFLKQTVDKEERILSIYNEDANKVKDISYDMLSQIKNYLAI